MNDILEYVTKDAIYRRYDHQHLTFSLLYAFTENFILPFSHDEVVHGKRSSSKDPATTGRRGRRCARSSVYRAHPGRS